MSAIDMQSFDDKHARTACVDAPLDVCRCGALWPCPTVLQARIDEALAECQDIEEDGDYCSDAFIAVARVASILRGESDE